MLTIPFSYLYRTTIHEDAKQLNPQNGFGFPFRRIPFSTQGKQNKLSKRILSEEPSR